MGKQQHEHVTWGDWKEQLQVVVANETGEEDLSDVFTQVDLQLAKEYWLSQKDPQKFYDDFNVDSRSPETRELDEGFDIRREL